MIIPVEDWRFDEINENNVPKILTHKDWPRAKKYNEYPYYYFLRYDFFSTVMGNFANNPIDPNTDYNNIYFYYNVTLNNRLQLNKVRVNTYFFNELGQRFYIDSVSAKTEDLYYFKNTANYSIIKDKLDLNLMVNRKSQFWRHYDYREDSLGNEQRYFFPPTSRLAILCLVVALLIVFGKAAN